MATEVTKRLFNVDEYYKMVKAGILTEFDRVELIDGEIVEMSAIGYRHWMCVTRLTNIFIRALGTAAVVVAQNSVRLDQWNQPEPDLVVYKPRSDYYAERRANPEDVLLLIEVADSSLSNDQKAKLPRYAAAGTPEYWIEDLQHDLLLVYLEPRGNTYNTLITLRPGDSVSPAAFPDVKFSVEELLSTDCIVE